MTTITFSNMIAITDNVCDEYKIQQYLKDFKKFERLESKRTNGDKLDHN